MTDGGGTVTYGYDNLNHLTGVSRGSDSFSYGYDPAGNVTSETYPGGTTISYAYNDDAHLASVTSSGLTTSYGYDPAGNLTTTSLPSGNGYSEARSYDKAGRLVGITNSNGATILSAHAYTLDPVGNPTEVDQTGATSSTSTYGYDSLNRITSVCLQMSCPSSGDPKTSWTYDNVGNRLSQTTSAGTTSYTYNSDDELTAAGSTSYSYDNNGNQTAAGANSFGYDLANRLISSTVGSTTTSYSYDGDGNRLTSNDGTTTTNYTWDPAAGLPRLDLEKDGSGNVIRRYLYGSNRVSLTTGGASPATFYYHYDGLGSVTNLTDASGNSQWTYSYDPWGNTTVTKDDSAAPANPMQFTGGYLDATGYDHLGARQYDPTNGRFTTTDPANTASGSTYAYVDDQPTVAGDPMGLWSLNPIQDFMEATNAAGSWIGSGSDPFVGLVGAANAAGSFLGSQYYSFASAHPCIALGIQMVVVAVGTDGLGEGALLAEAAAEEGGAISMDEAVARGAAHVGGRGEMVATPKGNYQFIGEEFTNAAGNTQRNIARFDVRNLRPDEVPHLNLEVQVNGASRPVLDPHTPIIPSTIRAGDHP
jgi:RHS repeat-associated protein